jgi:hypothetical protein
MGRDAGGPAGGSRGLIEVRHTQGGRVNQR